MPKRIRIYSTPDCTFCKMAKDFLKQNNIPYESINVAEDAEAREEMIEKSGQIGVPVIDIEGEIIIGFDKGRIKKILGLK